MRSMGDLLQDGTFVRRTSRATFSSAAVLQRLLYFLPSQLTFLYPKEKALDWLGASFLPYLNLQVFFPAFSPRPLRPCPEDTAIFFMLNTGQPRIFILYECGAAA
jgi:hypothetical protein